MKYDEEFSMLMGEISHEDVEFETLSDKFLHATSHDFQHLLQQQQCNNNNHRHGLVHVHGGNGRGSSPKQRIHGLYDDDSSYHHKHMCVSPVSGFNLQSEGSSRSSFSGWLSPSDDGSPTPHPIEEIESQKLYRNTHYSNGPWMESNSPDSLMMRNAIDNLTDELGLSESLGRLHVTEEQKDSPMMGQFPLGSYGFQFSDCSGALANHGNVAKNGHLEDYWNTYSDYRGLYSSPVDPMNFNEEQRLAFLELQQKYQMGNLLGPNISPGQLNPMCYRPATFPMSYPQQQTMEPVTNMNPSHLEPQDSAFGRNCWRSGFQVPSAVPCMTKPSIRNSFLYTQNNWMDSRGERSVPNSLGSPFLTQSKVPLDVGNLLHMHSNLPMFNKWAGGSANSWSSQPVPSMRSARNHEAFGCEDSLILQGRGSNYVVNKRYDCSKEHKRGSCNITSIAHPEKNFGLGDRSHSREIHVVDCGHSSSMNMPFPLPLPLKYNSLLEVQGYIYFIAKDQDGCRFLQRKFDEGTPEEVRMIFNEIIHHVVELMMNPFGNYLMQKLLDVCTEEQRMQILLMVTSEPRGLVNISLNTHGTRVVQKLIETLKTQQQISLVISALEPGFHDLSKDLNGNHVVQRCLQCFSNEDNKFIFSAAAKFCVDIATHRHGCCVLQRCITHSTGQYRESLAAAISANGLHLAQNDFGNYVIQYILELKIPSATATLVSQFEGNYVHLSTQKSSSNVVEKCLNVFGEEGRSKIIHELLSASHFEQLLQDPYANYVIQSALQFSKGPLHASLVEAIRPHAAVLRTSPYSKRIYSRTISKK